ncbi:MAG TPA: RNA polymerase sigma factor [Ignavibacteriales bacterium]|nr:RNA polymerase sigma factor [Ignavibacteriales bacterium]
MTETSKQIEITVKKERQKLFNFIRKNVPVKEDAEDILQDVFYQFASGIEEIELFERVSAWLIKVAKNKIIDFRRKKREKSMPQLKIGFPDEESDDAISLADILPDLSSLPDEIYWQNQIWEEIEDALDEMPPEQSDVFIMNEFEGLSFKEISEIKQLPVNTLLSRKRYAVLFLRKYLKTLYEELKNNVQ